MHIAQKARVATIAVLATILLAGCATAEPSAEPAPKATSSASATAEQPQTKPEQRKVTAVEVIDPVTVVVTPLVDSDSLYGTKFAVHVNDIKTPAKGDCGYDETLAFAKDALVGNVWSILYSSANDGAWIDANGDHYGSLGSNGLSYGQQMVGHGFANPTATAPSLVGRQQDAQNNEVGLWATCPGFGK